MENLTDLCISLNNTMCSVEVEFELMNGAKLPQSNSVLLNLSQPEI